MSSTNHDEDYYEEDDEYNVVFENASQPRSKPPPPPSAGNPVPRVPPPAVDPPKSQPAQPTSTSTPSTSTSSNPPQLSQFPQPSNFSSEQTSALPQTDESLFELNLNTLQDKPWRRPGADITDYFNFGFNEESWQVYCQKQLEIKRATKRLMHNTATSAPIPPAGLQPSSQPSSQLSALTNPQPQKTSAPIQHPGRNPPGLAPVGLNPIGLSSAPPPPPPPPPNPYLDVAQPNVPILHNQRNFKSHGGHDNEGRERNRQYQ